MHGMILQTSDLLKWAACVTRGGHLKSDCSLEQSDRAILGAEARNSKFLREVQAIRKPSPEFASIASVS